MPLPSLTPDELRRYARQLSLPDIGLEGQRKLKAARVLCVGAGGLGSPIALYLAAAGVGTLGIVDFDVVDVTNLHRQLLHGTADVGKAKVASARARLADVNPFVEVITHETSLTAANALEIIAGYDLVVDGSDNFQTRYLVNDASFLLGKPNVFGSVQRFDGQAAVFGLEGGPCYRCLFREPPPPGLIPTCAEGGVFGVLPGLVGMIQATEAVKLVTGIGEPLAGKLLLVDALRMRFRTIEVRKDPQCPLCGTREITALVDYDAFCGVAPAASAAADAAQGASPDAAADAATPGAVAIGALAPRELADRIRRGDALEIVDVREPHEWEVARIEGARLVPLRTLARALDALPRDRDLVLQCHHGVRSRMAAELLREHGFTRLWNLTGGIDRWSLEVDPTVPRY